MNRKNNRCVCCRKDRVGNSKLCEKHILQEKAKSAFGSYSRWPELLRSLEAQNYRCAKTGKLIVLGINDMYGDGQWYARGVSGNVILSLNSIGTTEISRKIMAKVKEVHRDLLDVDPRQISEVMLKELNRLKIEIDLINWVLNQKNSDRPEWKEMRRKKAKPVEPVIDLFSDEPTPQMGGVKTL